MKKGIILQGRDFEILRSVYESTVISFEQLRVRHFTATNIQTASNRLCRLVKGGFIKGYRVGLVIYQGRERQINRVYSILPLGIQILSIREPKVVLRTEVVQPQFYSLVHDLLLNDVQEAMKKEHPNKIIVNSKLLKMLPSRTEQIPDLVMSGENREFNQAVELELTCKSEKRYREMITNYRLSSRWKNVFFICQDDPIQSKLRHVIGGDVEKVGASKFHVGKFHFQNLDDVLTNEARKNVSETNLTRSAA